MEESQLPPGFRFHPTDEELITCYLSPKVLDYRFAAKAIADVDLNKCEPWDLPAKASMGEREWYFFSLRDRKYPTGLRTNRATDAGYWKTTGKDKEILRCNVMVGMKKTLVFYRGRAPMGEKTNWVMHEYRLQNKFPYKPAKEEWVVCRVFKKSSNAKKPLQPSGATTPSVPDSPTSAGTELGVVDHASVCMDNLVNYTTTPGCFSSMRADESSSSSNLYVNWMLSSSSSSGREASSLQQQQQQQPSLLPWLGSSFSPFSGYQAMETANMSSLNSLLLGGDSLQQQQREHEPIWRGYGI